MLTNHPPSLMPPARPAAGLALWSAARALLLHPPPDRPAIGIALCVFGQFLGAVQDLVIKWFSGDYSVLQIVFVRGVVALPLIFLVARLAGGRLTIRCARPGLLITRGALGFFTYLAYYMALAALPLVQVVTIVFAAPIIVTVMSAVMLKEPVGARRWSALAVGFAAVVIVVGPSGDFRHLATILALLAAVTYAGQNLLTRVIGTDEEPWTVMLYTMLAFITGSVMAGVLVAIFAPVFIATGAAAGNPALQFLLRPWVAPPLVDGLLMLFLGFNTVLAHYCMVRAYRETPVSVVAPFEYTYLIWAVLFGYLIWAETPRVATLFGVALLVASGFYIFRRELRLSAAAGGSGKRRRRFRIGGFPIVDSGGVRRPKWRRATGRGAQPGRLGRTVKSAG